MSRTAARVAATLVVVAIAACGGASSPEPLTLDPALGGDATRAGQTRNAFSLPAGDIDGPARQDFEVGDSFFTQNWVTAPASTGARDGLGPVFNAQSCSGCHTLDGRGAPPEGPADSSTLGLLLRLSVPGTDVDGGPRPEPTYGGQLQDRGIQGVPAEGRMVVTWVTETGTYADGTAYELRRPEITIEDLAHGPLADDVMISPRLAPQVIGVGLLEAVPATALLAATDPDDVDADGISGRVNMVPEPRTGETVVGRFGWKANVATVEGQVAGAFAGDIGITSGLAPGESCALGAQACATAPNGGSPELPDDSLGRVVFYNRILAVPAMRDHDTDVVRAGATQFAAIGCADCHTATLTTGVSDIEVLADQTIHPYTDLLLHDMGDGLADGRPDHLASGTEWRTPPLWGLGLVPVVNGERFLLHDGRARSFEEAILWHGGEGQASVDAFRALDADERAEIVTFLDSL